VLNLKHSFPHVDDSTRGLAHARDMISPCQPHLMSSGGVYGA
jgi:hypothetical protein